MGEYIITDGQLKTATEAYLGHDISRPITAVFISGDELSEIVRCRDCKYFYEDIRDTSIGKVSVFVCDSEQWSTSSLMPSHKVEPDGFCAWGERKEVRE